MDEREYRKAVESSKRMKLRGHYLIPSEVALLHADAELAKVLADNEALRADAERYRWLRRKGGPELMYGREQYTRACLVCGNVETDLDAAIDKERESDKDR